MKEKQIVFKVLEVADVERLVSEMAGREIKVDEMEVAVIDGMPLDSMEKGEVSDTYITCEVQVDGEEIYDEEYRSPLDEFMPDMACVPEEYIFDFETSLFKSYERYCDSSD